MGKWVRVMDMRYMPSYANVKARLVYLHIAMSVDIATYTCAKSLRQIGRELNMTLAEVRHAVKQLESDGLIATHTATHTAAHNGTHLTTQLTTHLTILIDNENGAPNGAPNDTPNNTPNDTVNDTANDTQNNNNNNKQQEPFTLTNAREKLSSFSSALWSELGLNPSEAADLAGKWLQRMRLKKKTWTDEADALSHLISWAEKHTPLRKPKKLSRTADDQVARLEEYAATEERKQEQTEEEKDEVTWSRMMRYAAECEAKGDKRRMLSFLKYADEFCGKWGWKKMTLEEYKQKIEERRKRK